MNRRKFIGSTALIALGPSASVLLNGCTPALRETEVVLRALSSHEMRTIFSVSRVLFPHADSPDQPYLDVVQALDNAAVESDVTRDLLRSAVNGLDAAAEGNWLAASPTRKVEILEIQQGQAYFDLVLNTAIDTIYRNPEVWALLGYEGSSLEHGGYLQRGFDDISWLSETINEATN